MRARDAQQRQVIGIGQLAGEMHAPRVSPQIDFGQHPFAPTGVRGGNAGAVADIVAPHDHHARLRPGLQQIGQCAHEHVKPAVRFQIARDISDHFVPGGQHRAIGHGKPRGAIGADALRIHPFEDHLDAVVQDRGMAAGLPLRRAEHGIGGLVAEQQLRVHHPRVEQAVGRGRKHRIEPDVAAGRLVIVFGVSQDFGLGPDIAQEQRLSPAGVRDHQPRIDPFALQRKGGIGRSLGKAHRALHRTGMAHRAGRWRIGQIIDRGLHAGHLHPVAARDEHRAHGRIGAHRQREMAELCGHVLVHQHDIDRCHEAALPRSKGLLPDRRIAGDRSPWPYGMVRNRSIERQTRNTGNR